MNNPFSHFFHLLLLLSANSNLNFLFTVSFFLHILYASSSSTTTLSLNLQSFKLKSNGIWSRATRRKGSFLITFFFFIISSSSLGWNWSASTLNLNYMNIYPFSMCRLCLVSERKKKLLGGKETDEIQKEKKKGWKNELKENKLNIRGSGIHALKLAYTWCSIPSVCQFPWTNDNHTPRAGLIYDHWGTPVVSEL